MRLAVPERRSPQGHSRRSPRFGCPYETTRPRKIVRAIVREVYKTHFTHASVCGRGVSWREPTMRSGGIG